MSVRSRVHSADVYCVTVLDVEAAEVSRHRNSTCRHGFTAW